MFKEDILHVLTREGVVGFKGRRIDRNFLIENIANFSQHFYVCGPTAFVQDVLRILEDLGASSDSLVFDN